MSHDNHTEVAKIAGDPATPGAGAQRKQPGRLTEDIALGVYVAVVLGALPYLRGGPTGSWPVHGVAVVLVMVAHILGMHAQLRLRKCGPWG